MFDCSLAVGLALHRDRGRIVARTDPDRDAGVLPGMVRDVRRGVFDVARHQRDGKEVNEHTSVSC